MGILSIIGISFGCSAAGERLALAAKEGDLEEVKAILEFNPRLVRYSTFGMRNTPLHCAAANGHHETVSLLIESGANINHRDSSGQTPLMQACLRGHWEVVLLLVLYKANIHKSDCLSGGTALHFAALNGHSRCIRLLLADYVPSMPEFWNTIRGSNKEVSVIYFDEVGLSKTVNRKADGGITALHLAALNGHADSVRLLLDVGASVSEVTIEDGSTIDLIGAGSTALHYAACGGNAECCRVLIAGGASIAARNANGWTPVMVARSWHNNWLESILSREPDVQACTMPSQYISLPLMSIVKIARGLGGGGGMLVGPNDPRFFGSVEPPPFHGGIPECGWRKAKHESDIIDPCSICLESTCTVAVEGCHHEFCVLCALYLCSIDSTTSLHSPPGSVACPLCRHAIVKFIKLPGIRQIKDLAMVSLSTSCHASDAIVASKTEDSIVKHLSKLVLSYSRSMRHSSSSFRSLSFQRLLRYKFLHQA